MIVSSRSHFVHHQHQRRRIRRQRRNTTSKPLASSLEPIPEDRSTAYPQQQVCDHRTNFNSLLLKELTQQERARHGVELLQESPLLHSIAARHARRMANRAAVSHSVSSIKELQRALGAAIVGENVQSGSSLASMHWQSMEDANGVNRSNMLAPHYQEYGCGVARCKENGKFYTCQLFRASAMTKRLV